MNDRSVIDYLVIGHVSHDLTPDGPVAGGTVTFSSRVAHALGCRTAIVTSAAEDFDLDYTFPEIEVFRVPSPETTSFENLYIDSGRKQILHALAGVITADQIPLSWRRARIVHLGPIVNEIEPSLIEMFSNSLVGITPQGWYRRWKPDGTVYINDWTHAQEVLKLAAVVIVSPEDLPDINMIDQFREWCPLVILTRRSGGCVVYCRDETRHVPAPKVREINPTGAGDIFATSFLIRLHQTKGNPWEAAHFANQVAAASVAKQGLDEKIKAVKQFRMAI
ncbi:MAG: PfkB family carbohydrate kinase [Anaerolineae bacterium]|nr:MAG: PfkB family carbohydrate kinase [Anaerolineae bacterium]